MKIIRLFTISIIVLLSLLFFFPNVCNQREHFTFSNEERLSGSTVLTMSKDSVKTYISKFYDRGRLVRTLLGSHYRELWKLPFWVPIFNGTMDSLQFSIVRVGGGQQTTSIKLEDQFHRRFTLRSVDKDQARALPPYLQRTGVRALFRDQGSALNPFGTPVVVELSRIAGIPSTQARLVFVEWKSELPDSLYQILQNRIMLLEIEPDESWSNSPYFNHSAEIIDTEELFDRMEQGLIADTTAYAYYRLFDILIGDWDRHEDQWMWMIDTAGTARPLPMDRDMSFYQFDDGYVNRLALSVNHKFQSFKPTFDDLSGYLVNGGKTDSVLLKNVKQIQWDSLVSLLQSRLTTDLINNSFKRYPDSAYQRIGVIHSQYLSSRLSQMDSVARYLHDTYSKASVSMK
jgi:hypothetical protein